MLKICIAFVGPEKRNISSETFLDNVVITRDVAYVRCIASGDQTGSINVTVAVIVRR